MEISPPRSRISPRPAAGQRKHESCRHNSEEGGEHEGFSPDAGEGRDDIHQEKGKHRQQPQHKHIGPRVRLERPGDLGSRRAEMLHSVCAHHGPRKQEKERRPQRRSGQRKKRARGGSEQEAARKCKQERRRQGKDGDENIGRDKNQGGERVVFVHEGREIGAMGAQRIQSERAGKARCVNGDDDADSEDRPARSGGLLADEA